MQTKTKKIGVFDSGYGGLTILSQFHKLLPSYHYIYLGDNARAPYGDKSFDTVYHHTLQAVKKLFSMDCDLVILACNTASAKALRTIQQNDLKHFPEKRVLGVIRPSAEILGNLSNSKHVGIMGTLGTVNSESYLLELAKFFPHLTVTQHACPLWVPLIESGSFEDAVGRAIIQKDVEAILKKDPKIDLLLLACTHYPLVQHIIETFVPPHLKVQSQGEIVATSLVDYLQRHSEISSKLSLSGKTDYFTTEEPANFAQHATLFLQKEVQASHLQLEPSF